jgi:diacylglycerol kinase family enzyme
VDAHLFYKLNSQVKNRSGMAAYYFKAWQLWATYRMHRFEVEYSNGTGHKERALLTELLAVRIRFFGNILRELVPGASLECSDLRAVMCRTASRNAYLQYVARGRGRNSWSGENVEPVTHFLFGAAMGRAGLNRKTALATATLTLAAEAPTSTF